ncbi:MAG: type VI secretion system tip protein TssI/VgrG [Candidatus Desantisbacteria bacterium]
MLSSYESRSNLWIRNFIWEDRKIYEVSKFSLQKKYSKREYCVQYRESDLNFICRLLEEEGIFYFFQHEKDKKKEVMGFVDSSANCPDCATEKKIMFKEQTGGLSTEVEYVYECRLQQEVISGKVTLNDFNYEKPNVSLLTSKTGNSSQADKNLEVYDYPGGYNLQDIGEKLVRVRMEEIDSRHLVVTGKSNWRSLGSGCKMTLTNHYRDDLNKDYLITRVIHQATQGSIFAFGESGEGTSYNNHFECIPLNIPFHPSRVTPHPTVKGGQTATVVGPSGEKIYFDKLGRVKVQFHWDREGKKNENSTCWVRVSQGYAGIQHGIQFMPLIGDEVREGTPFTLSF